MQRDRPCEWAHFFDLGGPSHYSGNYVDPIGFEHCGESDRCASAAGPRRSVPRPDEQRGPLCDKVARCPPLRGQREGIAARRGARWT